MIANDCINSVCNEIRAVGLEPVVAHGGKHAAIRWSVNGVERIYHTALTPSDRRGHLNARSDVRNMLRQDGLLASDDVADVGDQPRPSLINGAFRCSSRDIAAHFGKAHKHVLRDIDRILEDLEPEFGRTNFGPSFYVNEQNKQQRCFLLTRDGFTLLAMGFSGSQALAWKVKYIDAFNAMEAELRKLTATENLQCRLDKLEGDMAALIDICLSQPQPEPGYIVVRAHRRKISARRSM